MKRSKKEHLKMEIEGTRVPVQVYRERRRSLRAAVGKDSFILRMPSWLTAQQEEEGLQWFRKWAAKTIRKDTSLLTQFNGRTYRDGEFLTVGKRQYRLRIEHSDRKTHSGRLLPEGVIRLQLSRQESGPELSKSIRTLLSRLVAQDFQADITRRVLELNERHFRRPIKGVRLKYNHSNWGSCSRNGNINLSTRLLFAPDNVIDYVIIHELAHLIELNHSPRFWKLVEKAMPDYQDMERWLRENRNSCDF